MTTDNNTTEDTVPDEEPTVICHVCAEAVHEDLIDDSMSLRTAMTRFSTETVYLCEPCSHHVNRCEINEPRCRGWDDDLTYTEDGYACDRCVQFYEWCEHCDEYRRNGCDYCRESEESNLIHSYSWKPEPVFHHRSRDGVVTSWRPPTGAITVGIELETGAPSVDREELAYTVQDAFGDFVYLKEDCSVGQYNGFEIVSHPFTLEYLRGLDLDGIMARVVKSGARAGRFADCGLHAHIGRKPFFDNPTALYRFFALLYSNVDKWQAVGGRGDVHWARWDRGQHGNVMDYVRHAQSMKTGKRSRKPARQSQYERHVAVNLMNENTIELRYAKATLNATTLRARFEGYFGLAMYSLSSKWTSVRDLGRWEPFMEFCASQKLDTFVQYVDDNGIRA